MANSGVAKKAPVKKPVAKKSSATKLKKAKKAQKIAMGTGKGTPFKPKTKKSKRT